MKKRAFVFLATGFETVEALAVVDVLRRGGIEVTTVSVMERTSAEPIVVSAQNIGVRADVWFDELIGDADLLFLPGGLPGATNLQAHEGLCEMLKRQDAREGLVSAICAAPSVLGACGILQGRRATCYPGWESRLPGAIYTAAAVERDGHVLTGCGMGKSIDLGLALLEALTDRENAEKVRKSIQF